MPSYSVNSTTAVPVSSADNELCIQINKGVLWGLWVYAVKKEKRYMQKEKRKKEKERLEFLMFPQTILSLKYTPKVPHNPKKTNQIPDLDRFMHV